MGIEFLFKIILIVEYSIFTIIRAQYYRLARKAGYRTITEESKSYSLLLGLLITYEVVTFFIYLLYPWALLWAAMSLPLWLRWTGVFIGITALLLFIWVHRSLGSNFSTSLRIKDGHTLVTSGPYRWIRHPMYTAFYLLHFSAFLLMANWFIGITWIAGLTMIIALRIRREEAMMIEKFGESYRYYMMSTSRFIPPIKLNLFTKKKNRYI